MDAVGSLVFVTDLDLGEISDVQFTLIMRALEVTSEVGLYRCQLICVAFPTMLLERRNNAKGF